MQPVLHHDKPVNNRSVYLGVLRILVALSVMLGLFATAYAEKTAQKVTLSFKNAKIEHVFSEISKQTDYRFFYSDEVTRKATPVNISVKDVEVMELVRHLMDGQSMKYKVIAGTIIVNLISRPDELVPPTIVPQPIIVLQEPDDEERKIPLLMQATAGTMKVELIGKPEMPAPDRILQKTLLVEEPGGS